MRRRWLELAPEALILAALGALMTLKALNGELALYIHPRYHLLLGATGVVLMVAAIARMLTGQVAVPRRMLLLPLLVIAFMVAVPARPLGASLVPTKGVAGQSNADLIARLELSRTDDTTQWTLLEWSAALRKEGVAAFVGKPVAVEGFVYRDETLPEGAVYVGRYVVTCCTADGRALSLAVSAPNAESFASDQWARVEGVVTIRGDGPDAQAIVEGTMEPIDTPKIPYLYP